MTDNTRAPAGLAAPLGGGLVMPTEETPRWALYPVEAQKTSTFLGRYGKYDAWFDRADGMVALLGETNHSFIWRKIGPNGRLDRAEGFITFDQECDLLRKVETLRGTRREP